MADRDAQWYFNAEQLQNSPSRKCGVDADKELQYRQQTAYLIQEMGQHLRVSQLCINTAIVYMHRFYAFHSFTHFKRNDIAAASLFLAAKVEEQPRKLEHVIRVVNASLNEEKTKEEFHEQAQDLVFNENVLLQTLGFDVAIDHPHTHVVKTCHLVKAGKDLAQTSYFMASNSLHLTTMCLQYKPTVVACFCIHLACKWSSWEIPNSTEGRPWFHYVDKSVTTDLLSQLTEEFIQIYQKSPSRLKNKLNSIKALVQGTKPEDSVPAQQHQSQHAQKGSNSSNGNNNNPVGHRSSSSSSASTTAAVSAGGNGGGGGGHHHHHHHHHHSKVPPGQQSQSTSSSTSMSGGQSQVKQSSSSAFNNNQSRPRSDSGSSKHHGGVPTAGSASSGQHHSRSGGGNGNSGMHNSNPNSGGSSRPRPPQMPSQQSTTAAATTSSSSSLSQQAPSSLSSGSSKNAQKYNQQQQPQPPPPYSAENSMSSVGSKSNSPQLAAGGIVPTSASVGGGNSRSKQPLFMSSYPDNKNKSSISEDAFQFSIDDLRDAQDSQDSNQMGMAKSQKLQSIFCPDWKEDYSTGNTEHAKMNLPIGSTGDTKAPMNMMQGQGGSKEHHQSLAQQQQQQRMMQKGGSSSASAGSGPNMPGMRVKQEKKPEHQRINPFGGGGAGSGGSSSNLPSNNSSINSGGGSGSSRHHPSAMGVGKSSSSTSSSSAKRPYDEMMGNTGVGGGSDGLMGHDLSGGGASGGMSGDAYRDVKMRRSEVGGGEMGNNPTGYEPMRVKMEQESNYDPITGQRVKIEKDFTDYRDSKAGILNTFSAAGSGLGSGAGGLSSSATSTAGQNTLSSSSSSGSKFSSYSNSTHSIETNPDLVSSLLKESLNNAEQMKPFTTIPTLATSLGSAAGVGGGDRYGNRGLQQMDSGLGAAGSLSGGSLASGGGGIAGGTASTVSTSQLDQLINAPPQPFQQMRTAVNPLKVANGGGGGVEGEASAAGGEGGVVDGEYHHRHKSEKKKKKEKHKNKDKERDRGSKEERKKHKKDKERHKERHHYEQETSGGGGGVLGPLKLKLPKIEPGSGATGGAYESDEVGGSFKIKIPRNPEPIVPLKIKISKDKVMGSKEASVMMIKKEPLEEGEGNMGSGGGSLLGYHKKKDKEKMSKRDY